MNGHSGVVRLLLKAGADTGVADADGATAWRMAVQKGHLEVVRSLMYYAIRNYL